jgi:hypothetical protein
VIVTVADPLGFSIVFGTNVVTVISKGSFWLKKEGLDKGIALTETTGRLSLLSMSEIEKLRDL